ncbi:hypothetical protein DL546_008898 [Coniochaeta pulveracea]|uniref:GST N-terminal domain-containing protein n=1 Tax=Coniochaeta pulveracea TaxID=177199 RepID=A0A420YMX6_9PEZI|nr:hypothetical protein DL546_008898 [Coniochaeta pulveracea]
MSAGKITLFDLPSQAPNRAWSLNPWRTRLILNYKGLDYETKFVEYPDIKQTLKDHVAPNEDGSYTIPTIRLPDGTYIMDSYKIADALEESYPSPPLHLNSDMQKGVNAQMVKIFEGIYPAACPLIQDRILNPPSQAYWDVTRKECLALGPDPRGWEKADPGLKEVTRLLKEKEGPWFNGDEFTYADILWVGFLIFFKRIGDDMFEGVLKGSGDRDLHLAFLERASKWTERDSY